MRLGVVVNKRPIQQHFVVTFFGGGVELGVRGRTVGSRKYWNFIFATVAPKETNFKERIFLTKFAIRQNKVER